MNNAAHTTCYNWCNSTHSSLFLQIVVNKVTVVIFVAIVMAYNIFIFILFYSIAVVPYTRMYNKALIQYNTLFCFCEVKTVCEIIKRRTV